MHIFINKSLMAAEKGSGSKECHPPKTQVVTPDKKEDPAKKEQKKRGQLPLHDEPIGGG